MTSKTEAKNNLNQLRCADFKVGVILLLIVVILFVHTLSFPMAGSYGGVENQWYVSPALFPLIVLSILLVASILLITRAVSDGDARHFLQWKSWVGDASNTKVKDQWYVILLLCFYVYVYIPSIDFYLATALTLSSLMLGFYGGYKRFIIVILYTHAALITLLLILRFRLAEEFYLLSLYATDNEVLIRWSDTACGAALVFLYVNLYIKRKNFNARLRPVIITALLTPLMLILVFTYLLYVPMPVEYGSVMNLLNYFAYDIFQI